MTRSQAYRVLGLQPGATESEIRKQFKKLAFKVHPDVNPSERANDEFILLTQAMELLMHPEEGHNHHRLNDRQTQRQARKEETAEQREKRMQEARARYEQQKEHTFRENRRYITQLTTGRRGMIFKWINRVAVVIIAALILDLFLPYHYEQDELLAISKSNYSGISYNKITAVQLKNNGTYFMKMNKGTWFSTYPEVTVQESWLLHTPISFYSTDDFMVRRSFFDFHLGSVRAVVIILLLIPIITQVRRRRDLTFVFLYQFSFWGIGLLELMILFTKDRILHLLSLGFL